MHGVTFVTIAETCMMKCSSVFYIHIYISVIYFNLFSKFNFKLVNV